MNGRKTHQQFIKEVYQLVNNEYSVLSEYTTTHDYILMRHNICNHQYYVKPSKFLSGRRCPLCANKKKALNKTKTHEQFLNDICNLYGNEYTILSEYITARKHIKVRHNICNYIYETTPDTMLSGKQCSLCAGNLKYSNESFQEKINELSNNEYILLSNYINAREYVTLRHTLCNHEYKVLPTNFIKGSRCPICAETKGEIKIRIYFEKYLINHQSQYRFIDLLSDLGNQLRFDFAVFDIFNNLICLIEYDGIFHYEKQYDDDGFQILKYHDHLKDEYCLRNNIPLLRIPYYDFDNIERILDAYLSQFKSA